MQTIKYACISAILLLVPTIVWAQTISVDFEYEPTLFANANILPGDSETRWVQVTNHTDQQQVVEMQATNTYDCSGDDYCLADVMTILVEHEGSEVYMNTLQNFYTDENIVLGSIASGATEQFDVTVSFPQPTGNDYQELTTYFDLVIGFSTDNGGGSGGGGGGGPITPVIKINKAGSGQILPGAWGVFIITVTNDSDTQADNVVLVDTIPLGAAFIVDQGVPPGVITTLPNGQQQQTWDLGTIPARQVKIVKYTMLMSPSAAGVYSNDAHVSIDGGTTSPYYAEISIDFTVPTIAGFSYEYPDDPAGGNASTTTTTPGGHMDKGDDHGWGNKDKGTKSINPIVKGFSAFFGMDDLPNTGGDMGSWLKSVINPSYDEPLQYDKSVWVIASIISIFVLLVGLKLLHVYLSHKRG